MGDCRSCSRPSGTETHFTNGFDPEPRARRIFNVPKPSTLANILKHKDEEHPTWRGQVRELPPLDERPLRPAHITAIDGVETSLSEQRFDRSLIQMATGAGKTYTDVALALSTSAKTGARLWCRSFPVAPPPKGGHRDRASNTAIRCASTPYRTT